MSVSKENYKKLATSVENAHISGLLSKCKFRQPPDDVGHRIEKLLLKLDAIKDLSIIMMTLAYSEPVTVCMDFESEYLSTLEQPDALGWYSYEEGELLLGAKNYESDEFLGTLAHELAHWCMQTVFKNECLPYYSCEPDRNHQTEFQGIVEKIEPERKKLHVILRSVFSSYTPNKWHQELIVRVPQLIAQYGSNAGREILNSNSCTAKLLDYFDNYIVGEIKEFISDGPLIQARQTVYSLNKELGLFQVYQSYQIRFKNTFSLDRQNTSLLVIATPHPFLTFFQLAWTVNRMEPTAKFFTRNVFCGFDKFEESFEKVSDILSEVGECKCLFLVCPGGEDADSFENLFGILSELIEKKDKSVFLFVNENVSRSTQKHLKNLHETEYKFVKQKEMTMMDLDDESKLDVLDATVNFQGSQSELVDILDKGEHHLVGGTIIEKIIRKQNITIGKKCVSIRDLPPSFSSFNENIKPDHLVSMILKCESSNTGFVLIGKIDHYPKKLKDTLCDVFGCDDLSDPPKDSPIPIILILSDTEFDYSSAVRSLPNTEIVYFIKIRSKFSTVCNLLHYEDIVLDRDLIVNYHGAVESLKDGQSIHQSAFIEMLEKSDFNSAIISDMAGTGKTKFLNTVYNELMTSHWTVKSSLKELASLLDHLPAETELDQEYASEIIQSVLEQDDSFIKELLKSRMQNQDSKYRVILFLDGMDEISSTENSDSATNKEKVLNFIMFTKNNTFFKILVATRPETEVDLLPVGGPRFMFGPISSENSRIYLEKLCDARITLFSKDTGNAANVSNFMNDSGISRDFFKIPLHINMLVEILVDQFRNRGMEKSEIQLLTKLDKLYSSFVDIKYRIYFDEKKNIKIDQSLKKFYANFENQCNATFQHLALYYLYGNEDHEFARSFLRDSGLFRFENDKIVLELDKISDYSDIGIVSCSSKLSHLIPGFDFCHETFAEFYSSSLFISWTMSSINSELLVKKVICVPHRVGAFFESMLDGAEIPTAALSSHGDNLVELDFENTIHSLKHLIWFDRLNTVDLVLKSWKRTGQFSKILDPNSYRGRDYLNYPIFFAGRFSTNRVIERLLEEDFDLDFKPNERTFINLLVEKGNLTVLKTLVDQGRAELNLENYNGGLILEAVKSGNIELVQWLEEIGFDIKSTYELSGSTSIQHAVSGGKLNMIKWLHNRGFSVFYRTADGSTALHEAVKRGHNLSHVVRWLVNEGIDVNSKNKHGIAPIHVAVRVWSLPMVQLLYELGADIHQQSNRGYNALHCAAAEISWDIVDWLMDHGADVESKTTNGSNAIHIALKYSSSDTVVDHLLKWTSDTNSIDEKGRGYLHWATQNKRKFRTEVMRARGCNPNLRDHDGMSAAHLAIETMAAVEPYETNTEEEIDDYLSSMLEPFKLLVTEMSKTDDNVLTELLTFAERIANERNSIILDYARSWMVSLGAEKL